MYLARSSCVICGEHINKIRYNLKSTFTEKSNVLLIKLIEKFYKNVLFLHCNICTACYNVLNELDAIQQRQKELFSKLKENISKINKSNLDKSFSSDNEDDFNYLDSAPCSSPSRSTITGEQSKKDDSFEKEIEVDCPIDLKKLPITIKRVKAEINKTNTIDAESETSEETPRITKEQVDENDKLFQKIQSSIKMELSNRRIEQMNKEKPSKEFLCEICGISFRLQVGYLKHIKKHDNAEDDLKLLAMRKQSEWVCDVCNKSFQQKTALKRHLPIHTGVTRYQCEHCGKEFIHQSSFKMHLKIHANQRDAICDICKHAFLTRSHLKRHLRTAHQPPVKGFTCNFCQKQFIHLSALNVHIFQFHQAENHNVRAEDPLGGDSLNLDKPMADDGVNTDNEVGNINNVVINKDNVIEDTDNAVVDDEDLAIYNVQNALGNEEGILRIHEPTTGMTYTIRCSNLF